MKKQLFGLLLVGLALGGCAEMLVAELAVMGASVATSSPSSATSNGSTSPTQSTLIAAPSYKNWGDDELCQKSTYRGHWDTQLPYSKYADEAKRRGLSCGVGETSASKIASNVNIYATYSDDEICRGATHDSDGSFKASSHPYVQEATRRGLSCDYDHSSIKVEAEIPGWNTIRLASDNQVCVHSNNGQNSYIAEAKRRGLSFGVGVLADTQIASSATTPTKTAVAYPTNTSQPEAIPSTNNEASMTIDQSLKSRSAENKALQISAEEMPSSAILMICKTIKHADRLTQGVPVFHLNFDGGAQFLKWNSLTADILEVADEKITAHLEPPKGSFIRPLLTLDRYSGTFMYQPWGGHGMYHGKCELAEAKKKLF